MLGPVSDGIRRGVVVIEEIRIREIGGISRANLSLRASFVAITGESGSGKSSLVRAFELLSGARSQSSMIHGESDEGEVLAVMANDGPLLGLGEDLQPQEGTTIIRRILSRSGRSRAYLQGKPVPLSTLSQAMAGQLGIQSQFAQLGLLDAQGQLDLLDGFGDNRIAEIRGEIRAAVAQGLDREREIAALREKRTQLETRWGKAQEILEKTGTLHLKEGQDLLWSRELEETERRITEVTRLKDFYNQMAGGGSERGLVEALEEILLGARDAFDGTEGEIWAASTEQALASLQRLQRLLASSVQLYPLEELEQRREFLERRLGKIRQIQRLAKVTSYEELLDYCAAADKELQWVVASGGELERLQHESREWRRRASSLALELRALRQKAAEELSTSMNHYLIDLAMENLRFHAKLLPLDRIRPNGADDVLFELQGEGDFRGPVSRIASGGELSRILLALQLCLPDAKTPKCLVFDEVEAGLGGRAALLAGYKLRDLSRRCQVLLVTHEAAIAALAEQHYVVRRSGNESAVVEIDGEDRVTEIARMLAGDGQSLEARKHSRALLEEALSAKISVDAKAEDA